MAAPLDGHPHSPALPHSTSATPGRPLLAQQLPAMPTRSLSPTPALLVPLAALARQLLALHLAPLLAAWTLLAWAQAAVSAVRWRLRVERRHCPALVIAYRRCVGGYHSDLQAAWASLEKAAAAAAPEWRGLPRATLLFDDQINFPADRCRSALGFVLPAGGADDLEAEAAAWRAHPAVTALGLAVGVLPAGACLAVCDLPCCGPLSYLLCLLRALDCLRAEMKASGVHAQVPGLVELLEPRRRRLAFLLPLEPRADLLPF